MPERNTHPLPLLFVCVLLALTSVSASYPYALTAQTTCEAASAVQHPVDTSRFMLVQAYGVPSPRHQGRYHTGEDWHLARGQTTGQPVHAMAAGRVTYSYPLGWGRDGGVVIIEHVFGDGVRVYSQYGHLAETDDVKLPPRLSCVVQGQVIGTIGDVRPAPHLHFEVRVSGGDWPGPGYTWTDPHTGGWRDPSQFIRSRTSSP